MNLPPWRPLLFAAVLALAPVARAAEPDWVAPMKKVHADFKGAPGTFAHFGDSITVSMAFWAPLAGEPKNMSPEMKAAHDLVKGHMKPECWNKWKGPEFGNNGSMTVRWNQLSAGSRASLRNPSFRRQTSPL